MSAGHIVTYTGALINPLDPDPEQIRLRDIAHALSQACRFTGHTRIPYFVAQHSVIVSDLVPPENALVGLMHDASEAYLSDIASPVKQQPAFGDVYKAAEERLMHAIAARFGFEWPPPDTVKRADMIALRTEQRDLMPMSYDLAEYTDRDGEFLPRTILPWTSDMAEAVFVATFDRLARVAA